MTDSGSRRGLQVQAVSHNVLRHIDLEAEPGQLVALTGHSGSGKSTLCHLIAGLERPTQGSVSWQGTATHALTDWARISVVPQRLALLDQLTAMENLILPIRASGRDVDPDQVRAGLDRLGVPALADRPVGQGSIGEQQRIAVARALVLDSELVVLDEPTAHQDDDSAARVIAAVMESVQGGALVVTSTHDPRLLGRADLRLALGSG